MSKILEARAPTLAAPAHRPFRPRAFFERESVFSWLMMAPPLLFLVAFLGYPFFYGVYLSFYHREVAGVPTFVGLKNFGALYGALVMALSLGTAFGPLAAGAIFDLNQSYTPFLLLAMGLMALSAFTIASLGRPPAALAEPAPATHG